MSVQLRCTPVQRTKVSRGPTRVEGPGTCRPYRIVWKDGVWHVPSQSGNGKYRVALKPAARVHATISNSHKPCKHIHAARFALERHDGDKAPDLDTEAVPKKPTYPQTWAAYNLAQTTEKHRFQELLADLCRGVPGTAAEGRPQGRPCARTHR